MKLVVTWSEMKTLARPLGGTVYRFIDNNNGFVPMHIHNITQSELTQ